MLYLIFDVLESEACCWFGIVVAVSFSLFVWFKQNQWEYAPKDFSIISATGQQIRTTYGTVWLTEVKYRHPLANGNIQHHWDVSIIPECTQTIRHGGGVYTATFYNLSPQGAVATMEALYAYNRAPYINGQILSDRPGGKVLLDKEEGRIR